MNSPNDVKRFLIETNASKNKDRFNAVINVLDNLFGLFESIFIRARYFELGLTFFDICQQELTENRDKIEDWIYERYQIDLILLKLHMLDYLNEWDEYIAYTHWIIENIKIPYFNDVYSIEIRYKFYTSEDSKLHFLYQERYRYAIIKRKIKKRNEGKNVEHLKRHQQDRLTYEDIEYRCKIVQEFFFSMNYNIKFKYNKRNL